MDANETGRIAAMVMILLLSMHASASAAADADDLCVRIDRSLDDAVQFLLRHQASDGAWRSRAYGPLRDGPSLTGHVLPALGMLPGEPAADAHARGREYLLRLLDDQPPVLHFPVYTLSGMARLLATPETEADAARREKVIELLRQRQLAEPLGWSPDDAPYGGWGYGIALPGRPEQGPPWPALVESNLSATMHAVEALRALGVPGDDPVFERSLSFVERCQNYSVPADEAFDDGGFYFCASDSAKNKAGPAGVDRLGRPRFHSYGSMTADGIRALLACGLPAAHPRVGAGRTWLEQRVSVTRVPGAFAPDREVLRDSYFYYYCASLARAMSALDAPELKTSDGTVPWAEAMAAELLRRQNVDGSWTNPFTDSREDDPLVATPFAVEAQVICRDMLR
jgi:hypothetical protein